jgi:hypothetical protein
MTSSTRTDIQTEPKHCTAQSLSNGTVFSIADFSIPFEDSLKGFLGKGSFASVFQSVNEKDGNTYALKIVW